MPGYSDDKEAVQKRLRRIEGRTMASLAVSAKAIYLRSDLQLYRIELRGEGAPK